MVEELKEVIDTYRFSNILEFLEKNPTVMSKVSLRNLGKKRMVYLYKVAKAILRDEDYKKQTIKLTLFEKTREEWFRYFGLPAFDVFL